MDYGIGGLSRREILKMSTVIAASGSLFPGNLAVAEAQLRRTPNQILGPFYPLKELTQTTDLTRLPGRPDRAKGQVLNVAGKVLNVWESPYATRKSRFGKLIPTGVTRIQAIPIWHHWIRTLRVLPS